MSDTGYPYDWTEGVNPEPEPTPDADPWVNGRYALAALVWGLIAIVVLGLGAGP